MVRKIIQNIKFNTWLVNVRTIHTAKEEKKKNTNQDRRDTVKTFESNRKKKNEIDTHPNGSAVIGFGFIISATELVSQSNEFRIDKALRKQQRTTKLLHVFFFFLFLQALKFSQSIV